MADFLMPSLGADMDDGTLLEWRVAVGDQVHRGDIVAVVDTDKAAIEVEAWMEGEVTELVAEVGQKIPVGEVIARIAVEGEEAAEPAKPQPSEEGHRRASPAARRKARELGVDLSSVKGTGPQGAITLADIEAAADRGASGGNERTRSDRIRAAIAVKMARANAEIPHYYLKTTIDMSRALAWLEAQNAEREPAERLLAAPLLLKATALGLRKVPALNGFWDQGALIPSEHVHLGNAISLRGGGVVVPAIHDADTLSLDALMAKLRDLVARARKGSLKASELSDATATVTSLGERAPEEVFGVIFPPQVALIGFGSIDVRPWAVDGEVVARPLVTATLAADHRATDGHLGGRLLTALAQFLQEPENL